MTGKILKDEDTVESYKIEEKGFVVCVVNKVNTTTTYDYMPRSAYNRTAQS
jgi:hypothetical protein